MYATCLFCSSALGANQSLEHFPVGRRLAFDGATGRLWVVCRKCDRWNLSPLETRWEAIEEAERAFRSTKRRVSTDNIALARLADGLELVRIGAPPKAELAVWRYGDQFGKRYRKFMARSAGVGVSISFVSIVAPAVGVSVIVGYSAVYAAWVLGTIAQVSYLKTVPSFAIRADDDSFLRLTPWNVRAATFATTGEGWELHLPHVVVRPAAALHRLFGTREVASSQNEPAILTGVAAHRALAALLPHWNQLGGTQSNVRDALDVIDSAPDLATLLSTAAKTSGTHRRYFKRTADNGQVCMLPQSVKFALEMSLHEDDERRAMEGELHELEQRWRDADTIGKIADSLLLPANIGDQMTDLRKRGANG